MERDLEKETLDIQIVDEEIMAIFPYNLKTDTLDQWSSKLQMHHEAETLSNPGSLAAS